jgi:hypothetical protein
MGALKRKLREMGAEQYPEYEDREFFIPSFGGVFILSPPEKIASGSLGQARTSWGADRSELTALVGFAEKMGARVYDDAIKTYITRATLSRAIAQLEKDLGRIVSLIGAVRPPRAKGLARRSTTKRRRFEIEKMFAKKRLSAERLSKQLSRRRMRCGS